MTTGSIVLLFINFKKFLAPVKNEGNESYISFNVISPVNNFLIGSITLLNKPFISAIKPSLEKK